MDIEAREAVRVLQRAGLTTPEAFLRYAEYNEDPSMCLQLNFWQLRDLENDLIAYWTQKMTKVEMPFDEVDYAMGFAEFHYLWSTTIEPSYGSIVFIVGVGTKTQRQHSRELDLDHIARRILGEVGRREQVTYGPPGRPPSHVPPHRLSVMHYGHQATIFELSVETI